MNARTESEHHIVRARHPRSTRLRQQRSRVTNTAALHKRSWGQNGLHAARTSSHPVAYESPGDQSLACHVDADEADGQALDPRIGAAHAVEIAMDLDPLLRDSLSARMFRTQIHQRPNDAVDPVTPLARHMVKLLEVCRGPAGIGPAGGVEGVLELLGGVVEVDEVYPFGQRAGRKRPGALRPSPGIGHRQDRPLPEHRLGPRDQPRPWRLARSDHPALAHVVKPLRADVHRRHRRPARIALSALHRRHHLVERPPLGPAPAPRPWPRIRSPRTPRNAPPSTPMAHWAAGPGCTTTFSCDRGCNAPLRRLPASAAQPASHPGAPVAFGISRQCRHRARIDAILGVTIRYFRPTASHEHERG